MPTKFRGLFMSVIIHIYLYCTHTHTFINSYWSKIEFGTELKGGSHARDFRKASGYLRWCSYIIYIIHGPKHCESWEAFTSQAV